MTSMASRVMAVVLWTFGVLWLVPMLLLLMGLGWVLPQERLEGLSRLYCRGQVWWAWARWRAVVDEGIEEDRPYLFVQNHVNLFDHVTMYPATPHFKQGMELESHFSIPFYGWFMRSRGTIGVRRGAGTQGRDALREAMRKEVALGHSILGFPEGTRTLDGQVGTFRKGLFLLARDLGLAVVPVAVTGMYEVLQKGNWVLRPGGDVTVWCDAPMETSGLSDEEVLALAERAQRTVASRVNAHREVSIG